MSMHDPAPSGAPGRPAAAKVSPESMALRAQPRPVTRLNRRSLALLAGLLALGVLGATVWSLQPKTRRESSEPAELFNVDRVSRSEGLGQLPADYSKLPQPAPAPVPELGPPLPGDLGPAIVKSQQPVVPSYSPPGHDPAASEREARRKEAEQAAAASVFFRNGSQRAATAAPTAAAPGTSSSAPSGLTGFDPMAAGPASTPAQTGGADATASQNRQDQKEAFLKGGSTETRNSGNAAVASVSVPGDGRHGDRRGAGDGHQIRPAGRCDRLGDGAGL